MTPYAIYIVDDEAVARNGLKLALKKTNYSVKGFGTAESAIKAIDTDPPDLVLLDIGLPGMSGVEALEIIKQRHPEVIVVMITAYEDLDTVISAMRQLEAPRTKTSPTRLSNTISSSSSPTRRPEPAPSARKTP